MKVLCVFGKDQYGDNTRGLSTEYFSFIPAIKKLGHEVEHFDSWDRSKFKNFIELNQKLIQKVDEFRPDIIFSVQFTYEIWLETWDYISSSYGVRTVNWCTDDSWKFVQHSRFFANHFDLMVTTYEEFLAEYKKIGTNAVLSNWAVPVQWLRTPKKASECKYQVTFVGMSHGNRKEVIAEMQKQGVDVECFGYGWPNGPLDADKIPEIFNDSIISLNFSNSSGENQIKARTFEVPGSGGFLLTGNAKNLENFLEDGKEIVVFDDISDCVEKIKKYLNDFELRDQIAMCGHERVKNNYTYQIEIEKIFKHLNSLPRRNVKRVDFNSTLAKHKKTILTECLRQTLLLIGKIFFRKERSSRFARRLLFEFSWRFFGEKTFRADGLIGRAFYRE